MEEVRDVVVATDAIQAIRNKRIERQNERARLWEKIVGLDGEINAFRDAEYQIEQLDGYNVTLPNKGGA